jgi:hypothetical protein
LQREIDELNARPELAVLTPPPPLQLTAAH